MYPSITPVLEFEGNAEEAMRFYVSLFPNSKIAEIAYSQNENTTQNDPIQKGRLSINGQELICTNRKPEHRLGSGPAGKLNVGCASIAALHDLFETLSEGGKILLPITKEKNNTFCGQVQDKFGVIWQLSAQTAEDDHSESNVCFANSTEVRPEYRE